MVFFIEILEWFALDHAEYFLVKDGLIYKNSSYTCSTNCLWRDIDVKI